MFASVAFGLFLWNRASLERNPTVVIDGDPLMVASLNKENNTLVLVSIPATLSVDVAHGLGTYPISSLWQLGEQEGTSGQIMSLSVEELLAVSIPWFVGGTDQDLYEIFRFRTIPRLLSGAIKTNMTLATFLWLSWHLGAVTSDRVIRISIPRALTTRDSLPDGSERHTVSGALLDTVLSDEFEIESVRRERLTIRVVNTTTTPGLAERMARKVSRIGGNVVRTGNEEVSVEDCQIRASRDVLKSKTVAVLAALFGCVELASTAEQYSDLTVAVGRAYEARFTPGVD